MDTETSLESNELNQQTSSKQGGLKTMPFIIANEAFEKVASSGLTPNMTRYLMGSYNMDVAKVTTILALFGAATNFLPVAGAFVSDSFLGRFLTILLGCIASLLGMTLMWLTAMIPQAKPPACDPLSKSCESSSSAQLFLLYGSFVLLSIGAGGIRPCSLAFGADQFDKEGDPNSKSVVQNFFNWYYASSSIAVLFSFTAIVYIQDHLGWKVGFGIPAMFMLLSTLLFVLASSYYVKAKPNKSLFRGFAQVTVATFRNRHIDLPPKLHEGVYHHLAGSNKAVPTELLRFLNKACIIRNKEKDLNADEGERTRMQNVDDEARTVCVDREMLSLGVRNVKGE
ncbi:NRT1/ PTR FAMILY 1.1 [Thalictrum thalictroides]|uniref:NRT1/ PTR FAMILY 1.1 n=1 Tax=Thalictrum thalictroides TaxID=46969 RepID=A0A7J6WP24_THATH|nr:NRT1/ PTR FAMILY 1.1 [Thalictrum thalictroides]